MFRTQFQTLSALVVAALTSSLMVGCTQPVEVDAEAKLSSAAKNLPFSYDTSIDQIAHMSCSNMPMGANVNYNTSAYFTYRAGAYTTGGILLKDAFFDEFKNKKPEYFSEVLSDSPANNDTILQMALRSRTNYQAVFKRGGEPVIDQDFANMLTPLGTEEVSQLLIAQPVNSRVRFIRSGTSGGFRLEGSLKFTESAALVQSTRDFIQGRASSAGNTGLLAITYTNGSAFSARSIADQEKSSTTTNNQRSVFGRGYIMSFAKPSIAPLSATFPENTIASVQEQTLDSTNPISSAMWACPTGMQFRIVRSEDINKTGARCRKKADPEVLPAELRIVRNSLRSEDWYVDMDNRCIIPKKSGTGCYGTVTDIKYNTGDSCGIDSTTGFSNCVQFASICYRN